MAERAASRARRASQRDSATSPRAASDRGGADRAALERERDALRAELEAAKGRIAVLERERDQIVNRIDWIIDSLHSLVEDGR